MESHLIIAETMHKLKVDYLVDNGNYQTNLNLNVVDVLDTLRERIINALPSEQATEFKKIQEKVC